MGKHALPEMDFPFKIQMKGAETGVNWVGDFKYRRPTLGARSRTGALRARLNGDLTPDDREIEEFNHAISFLRYTLVEYPGWWLDSGYGLELYDGNVVTEVYNKCMEFEAEWRKKVHGGDETDVSPSSDASSAKELVRNAGASAI